jgi:hypothetical protein
VYTTDLALDRRFHGKLNVSYLALEDEQKLVKKRIPKIEDYLAGILCKVAHDSRYQMTCLRAPIDTDTLLKWAEEVQDYLTQGAAPNSTILSEAAKDIVYGVCIERGIGSEFDYSGVKILTDNINEAWKNGIANLPTPPKRTYTKKVK